MKWLLCKPSFYGIKYEINPWMSTKVSASTSLAMEQWEKLYTTISSLTEVELIEPKEDVPDMVFVANAGLVYNNKVIISNFKHPQRQLESKYYKDWFENKGYEVITFDSKIHHEGEGDALFAGENKLDANLFCGYGFRSSIKGHETACELLSIDAKRVSLLELKDPRFYHLDTCFFPINKSKALVWHKAFSKKSLSILENNIELIGLNEEDALSFSCNALLIGNKVIMPLASESAYSKIKELRLEAIPLEMGEFLKAGGAAKCLSLRLDN